MRILKFVFFTVSLLVVSPAFSSTITYIQNDSFEEGSLGWTLREGTDENHVQVIEELVAVDGTVFRATQGSKFLAITAGDPWSIVFQTAHALAGAELRFDYGFINNDTLVRDSGYVSVSNYNAFGVTSGFINPFHAYYWREATVTFEFDETFTISAGARNDEDFFEDSVLVIDNFRFVNLPESPAVVPLPSTLGFLGLGILGILTRLRTRSTRP